MRQEVVDDPPAAGACDAAYQTMWGPCEFIVMGNLSGYERTDRLQELTVPLLFTCGRHDLTTPEATSWYQSLAPGAQVVIFEASAHMPHFEEPECYLQTLRDFLQRVEAQAL
jgi:proline iminopeptidase